MKPNKTCQGFTFFPVPEFSDSYYCEKSDYFPRNNLPDVPREYEDRIHELFFNGGKLPEISPQVDRIKATNYLSHILVSWSAPHESKITTAAYALWVWMTLDNDDD